jgi:hypothetical protein
MAPSKEFGGNANAVAVSGNDILVHHPAPPCAKSVAISRKTTGFRYPNSTKMNCDIVTDNPRPRNGFSPPLLYQK